MIFFITLGSMDVLTVLGSIMVGATFGVVITLGIIMGKKRLKDKHKINKEIEKNSHSNILDQVNNQLIPFLPEFLEKYNPKDARFLGNPIDLIIFDGLDKGELNV